MAAAFPLSSADAPLPEEYRRSLEHGTAEPARSCGSGDRKTEPIYAMAWDAQPPRSIDSSTSPAKGTDRNLPALSRTRAR